MSAPERPEVARPAVARPAVARPAVARRVGAGLLRGLRGLHWYLREVSGEADYDRYLARHRDGRSPTCGPPLRRREFERLRWDGRGADPGSRCC